MINQEKLSKIFEIYKDLNQEQKLEILCTIRSTEHPLEEKFKLIFGTKDENKCTKPQENSTELKNNEILVTLRPNAFNLKGNSKLLSKEIMLNISEKIKQKVDEEYASLKLKLNDLKNKLP